MGNAVAVMDAPMGRINAGKVILGGLVAGLAINISQFLLNMVVVAADMATALARMNLPPIGGSAILIFVVLGFAGGVVMIWIYAGIRPRFGPGPATAVIAGLVVWFLAYLYSGIAMSAMGMYPMRMMAITWAWGLVESIVAALAGAALYSEA
jgi:hypothetical protein